MTAVDFPRSAGLRVRLPVRAALRLGPLGDIWHKPALSAVVALAAPLLALLWAGRLDLVLYAAAGSMCALYGHGLPYAARAKALGWVVLGMVSSTTVALVTAALTDSVAVRVAVAALLAGLHKAACDATRIGPPGNVVLTFVAASAAFVPQELADVPAHVGLGVLGGAVAWAVGMAPGLVRPDGPERIAVARALESVARLLRAAPHQERHAAAAAINAAWQTLLRSHARTDGLAHLLIHAESAAARTTPASPHPNDTHKPFLSGVDVHEPVNVAERADEPAAADGVHEAGAAELVRWARDLREGCPLPNLTLGAAEQAGAAARRAASVYGRKAGNAGVAEHVASRGDRAVPGGSAGGSAGGPVGGRGDGRARGRVVVRRGVAGAGRAVVVGRRWRVVGTVFAGAALAGWGSMAFGVGRPYWAVVTAAAVFAANATMSWSRALQRVVGNLVGVALFTLIAPVTGMGAAALVVAVLALQFVTEAAITRNYWLGSVFVTPMAILMTEFAGAQPVGMLVRDRWLDTCLGAAAGLLACVPVPDRRAARRVRTGLERLEAALAATPSLHGRRAARDRLRAALVEVREAADAAAGEWWNTALPQERIAAAERAAHRRLADLCP